MDVRIEETADGRRLQEALNKLTNCSAKVGWFEGQPYPDGTSVAMVAMTQEYGSPAKNIPPRPFVRPTISKYEKQWANYFEKGSKELLKNEITIEQIFEKVASKAASQIKKSITEVTEPPLAQATINARLRRKKNKTVTTGLTKPLIDTKHMFRSLSYVVEKE